MLRLECHRTLSNVHRLFVRPGTFRIMDRDDVTTVAAVAPYMRQALYQLTFIPAAVLNGLNALQLKEFCKYENLFVEDSE